MPQTYTYRSAAELKSEGDVRDAIQDAISQINSCSVALANLGHGDDRLSNPGSPRSILLAAFCDLMKARDALAPHPTHEAV